MALLRLIAVAAIACCACRRTEAAPIAAPAAAPAGWKGAPELAKAAADAAKTDAVKVASSEAWSQPAMGCYGVSLRLTGGAAAIDRAADQLVASVQHSGVIATDIVKPGAGDRGMLSLGFTKAPYQGTLRAELVKTGEVAAVACLWNQREPKACAAACGKLLEAVK